MAVPNTTTFSLNDVRNELGLGSTASLSACFNAAVDAQFDSAYKGIKDRLSNFRNYGATPFVPALTINPSIRAIGPGPDNFSILVTSNTSWSVSDNAAWVTFSPSTGSNNGSVSVSHLANTGNERYATVTIVTTYSGGSNVQRTCVIEQAGSGGNP